jgi:hypothetical protein
MMAMKSLRVAISLFFILALLAGCGLPMPAPTQLAEAPVLPPQPTLTSPVAPSPTPSLPPPTSAPTPTSLPPTPTAVATPSSDDIAKAALKVEDFPKGFQTLDAAARTQLNLTPEALGRAFEGTFRQAKPVLSFGYFNPDAKAFEVVVGVVFYPLTPAELDAFDHMLSDPNGAMKNFAQSFGGQVQPLESMPQVGNVVNGWSFISTSGTASLKGEMVFMRRETAVTMLLALYLADQKPAVVLAALAPLVDLRLKTLYEKK